MKMTLIADSVGKRGFTLVELLVVLAVIGILAALILPALFAARFKSKVTVCSNNYKQWGVAVALYATEDGKGRLPSFPLPVESMTNYSSLEPWWVAFEMVTNMAVHGVTVPMWFCPTRPDRLNIHRENFRALRGRDLVSPADLVDEFAHFQKSKFVFPDLMWWVPRRLGASSLQFPDPLHMTTRVPDPWPSRLDDRTVSTQPIVSDWLLGEWDETTRTVSINNGGGGHAYSRGGEVKSINVGFADGHVETRPKAKLQWQAKGPGQHAYVY